MSEESRVLEAQVQALVELVESYRARSCASIEEQARTRAHEIIARARREARARMRAAIEQERAHTREQLNSTRARLLTQRRQRRQHLEKHVVEIGWARIEEALARRWRDTVQREAWIRALAERGYAMLPAREWRVEHAPGWDSRELLGLDGELGTIAEDRSPTFVEDAEISAGLRIRVDGTCLDGTTKGLLTNREAVEGQLLAEVSRG